MPVETINLRQFLMGLRRFDQLYPIAQSVYYYSVKIPGFSKMRKATLVDALCERLDDPIVFRGVVNKLATCVSNGEYPQKRN